MPRRAAPPGLVTLCLAWVLALAVSGCASGGREAAQAPAAPLAESVVQELPYFWRAARGHLAILQAARPIDDWLLDPAAPAGLKEQLHLARRLRAFASRELHLPDNASYHRYADLGREAVLWNVVAAPALSLQLRTHCVPVAGCVGYRGHFDHDRALQEAQRLRQAGWDVAVQPVPAYSTLGRLNWLGGDPLLNTFIRYGEGELARLLFHELAHQVVYVPDDTTFNESFATAVERLGVQRWLQTHASAQAREQFALAAQRRAQWRDLTRQVRDQLAEVYAHRVPPPSGPQAGANASTSAPRGSIAPDEATRLARKEAILQEFRARYARLRAQWGGDPARYRLTDEWVAQANNASFGALAAYDDLVPAFEALFQRHQGHWPAFYDSVKQLGRLPPAERHNILKELTHA